MLVASRPGDPATAQVQQVRCPSLLNPAWDSLRVPCRPCCERCTPPRETAGSYVRARARYRTNGNARTSRTATARSSLASLAKERSAAPWVRLRLGWVDVPTHRPALPPRRLRHGPGGCGPWRRRSPRSPRHPDPSLRRDGRGPAHGPGLQYSGGRGPDDQLRLLGGRPARPDLVRRAAPAHPGLEGRGRGHHRRRRSRGRRPPARARRGRGLQPRRDEPPYQRSKPGRGRGAHPRRGLRRTGRAQRPGIPAPLRAPRGGGPRPERGAQRRGPPDPPPQPRPGVAARGRVGVGPRAQRGHHERRCLHPGAPLPPPHRRRRRGCDPDRRRHRIHHAPGGVRLPRLPHRALQAARRPGVPDALAPAGEPAVRGAGQRAGPGRRRAGLRPRGPAR